MKIRVVSTPVQRVRADLLVVGVYASRRTSKLFTHLQRAFGRALDRQLSADAFRFRPGDRARFPGGPLGAAQVWIGVVGRRGRVRPDDLRKLCGRAASAAGRGRPGRVALALDPAFDPGALDGKGAQAAVEGLLLGGYRFDRYRDRPEESYAPDTLALLRPHRRGSRDLTAAMERGVHTAGATALARDLVNEPPNVATPSYMLEAARTLARTRDLDIEVLGRQEMERRGMGCLLAVARGSIHPPYLVHLTYRPAGEVRARVALVGKCLTFDSGGLNAKTATGMVSMKSDMAGAAAVLGATAGAASLELPVEVHTIFAAAENLSGSAAYRPDDVLTAANGKTVEVGNTDAEGRLTLADALVYAGELGPDVVVDVATLTGACVVALGKEYSAVFATGRGLASKLIAAGRYAGDPIWQLPLPSRYERLIKGNVADLKNTGGRWAGAITAALFLREFAPQPQRWAHLDIAGPAMTDRALPYHPKGATGSPTRALIEFLERI